jgi:hypothetical protein
MGVTSTSEPASTCPRKMPLVHSIMWVWTSIRPGNTVRLPKSTMLVRELTQLASSASLPKARILPKRTAIAVTTGGESMVTMCPFLSNRSASVRLAAVEGAGSTHMRRMGISTRTLRRFMDCLINWNASEFLRTPNQSQHFLDKCGRNPARLLQYGTGGQTALLKLAVQLDRALGRNSPRKGGS